jgi:hypothetical protein
MLTCDGGGALGVAGPSTPRFIPPASEAQGVRYKHVGRIAADSREQGTAAAAQLHLAVINFTYGSKR